MTRAGEQAPNYFGSPYPVIRNSQLGSPQLLVLVWSFTRRYSLPARRNKNMYSIDVNDSGKPGFDPNYQLDLMVFSWR